MQCIATYMDGPQAIEMSTHKNREFLPPTITFCKWPPINFPNLYKCGLTWNINESRIEGSRNAKCKDPEEFWNFISLSFDDYRFDKFKIQFTDGDSKTIPVEENHSLWEKIVCDGVGTGFSLSLPKQEKDILDIEFTFKPTNEIILKILVHSKGLLNNVQQVNSFEYGTFRKEKDGSGATIEAQYDYFQILDCQNDPNYSYSDCVLKKAEREIYDTFGKLPAFGSNKSQIDIDLSKSEESEMRKIYDRIYGDHICPLPCQYHGNFDMSPQLFKKNRYKLRFKPFIKKFKSTKSYTLIDLFAALSGYLGSFLGLSLFQLKDGFSFVVKKILD